MKILALILIFSSSTISQNIELSIPNQNADSLSITSYKMTVDTITKNLEIIISDYSVLAVHHSHYRYKTSLYELDTIALVSTIDSTQYELRLIMCEGREFALDDPFKGKIRSTFRNKKIVRLGFWMKGTVETELAKSVKSLMKLIPSKEICNSKRDMRQFVGHNYTTGTNGEGVYYSGIQLPSLYGSNSIMSMHKAVQKHIDECQINVTDSLVIKIKFVIDKNGSLMNPYAYDCPNGIKENLYECMQLSKWKPATHNDSQVNAECVALIGFNVKDKYKYIEKKSKESKSKPKSVHIPDIALGGHSNKIDDEVFKIVEQMPKPINDKFFEELAIRAKAKFKNKKLNEVFKFIVEKDGYISNIECIRSSDKMASEWIEKELRSSLKYQSGKQRGKRVRVEVINKVKT